LILFFSSSGKNQYNLISATQNEQNLSISFGVENQAAKQQKLEGGLFV